jgi:hypothetical protein
VGRGNKFRVTGIFIEYDVCCSFIERTRDKSFLDTFESGGVLNSVGEERVEDAWLQAMSVTLFKSPYQIVCSGAGKE